MAKRNKQKGNADVPSTFSDLIFKISYRFPLTTVFDDFLTMAITSCTRNLQTGLSWYEDEYLQTIEKYEDSELRFEFPNAFAALVNEMEARISDERGNDVLGEFFEAHISNGRNGQFFTPYPICKLTSSITIGEVYQGTLDTDRPIRVLDPSCGSGRMLLAAHAIHRGKLKCYGIDIDQMCVKMAAINLFLNDVWNSEVMCANALVRYDFVIGYHISLLPLGIFKIEQKERSELWHLYQNSFGKQKENNGNPFTDPPNTNGSQLELF